MRVYGTDRKPLPVEFSRTGKAKPFPFKGYESFLDESPLTGSKIVRYTSTPMEFNVPLYESVEAVKSVSIPIAYGIPEQFISLVDKLYLHGIGVKTLNSDHRCVVERYRFHDVLFAQNPFEGRQCVDCTVERFNEEVVLPSGTFIVPTDQRTIRVIANLLEPDSPDSFVRWGFFNAFFERKEYAEPYIMEPIAREMLQKDPQLREEFYRRIDSDEAFRNDPLARLDFFYQRSPFRDSAERVYPIVRIVDMTAYERLGPSLF